MTNYDNYEAVCEKLSAALEQAVNDLQEEGMFVGNKWVIGVDTTDAESNKRYYHLIFPPEQAPWDSKGLLYEGLVKLDSMAEDDDGD